MSELRKNYENEARRRFTGKSLALVMDFIGDLLFSGKEPGVLLSYYFDNLNSNYYKVYAFCSTLAEHHV